MKRILLVVVLIVGGCASAQTAKVIQLKPEDAAKAADINRRIEQAKVELLVFNDHIREAYLAAKWGEASGCASQLIPLTATISENSTINYRLGWNCGQFEYSDDFKFIVPKPEPSPNPLPSWIRPAQGITAY